MLQQVTNGVWTHESSCIQSNTTIIKGEAGVLLVDPGLTSDELVSIADKLDEMGLPVVAGFSTHPHWDHVLWHDRFGNVPRYGTAAAAAQMKESLSNPDWQEEEARDLPEEIAGQVPLDGLFGKITALPSGTAAIPWDGPKVTVIEHNGHAPGHAALYIEEGGVLVAGDMLSDVFMPMLNLAAADPIGDYLKALDMIEDVAGDASFVIPGHGSVGEQVRERIALDRRYVEALRDGNSTDDPRIVTPKQGWEWVAGIHDWQAKMISSSGGYF